MHTQFTTKQNIRDNGNKREARHYELGYLSAKLSICEYKPMSRAVLIHIEIHLAKAYLYSRRSARFWEPVIGENRRPSTIQGDSQKPLNQGVLGPVARIPHRGHTSHEAGLSLQNAGGIGAHPLWQSAET